MGRKNLIRLSDVAQTLHDWLCLSCHEDSFEVNLHHFQQWIEQHTGKSHSLTQIKAAIEELESYQLIEIQSLRLKPNPIDPNKFKLK